MGNEANRRYLSEMACLVDRHKRYAEEEQPLMPIEDDMNALRDLFVCFQGRYQLEPSTLLRCIQAIMAPYPEATQTAMRATVEGILSAPLAAFGPGGSRARSS